MSCLKPAIQIINGFLDDHQRLFELLETTVDWDNRMKARKTASFGVPYNYSHMTYPACSMHWGLEPVAACLQRTLGVRFNNCLLNFYESGDQTMGFHSDDTSNLTPGTGVAIVSLGASREITYRSVETPDLQHRYALCPGSLLYMDANVQNRWMHAIKKQTGAGARISLTWRALGNATQ